MSRSRSALRVVLVAFVLSLLGSLLATLMAAPGATAAPASYGVVPSAADTAAVVARDSEPRTASRQAARTYRCGQWLSWPFGDDGRTTQVRSCVNITKSTRRYETYHQAQFFNKFYDRTANFACVSSSQKTYSFSASVTGEAEKELVFAKFKVSVTLTASYEITTKDEEAIRAKVKPREYVHCRRGMLGYKVAGTRRTEFRSRPDNSSGSWTYRRKTPTSYTAYVPSTLTYEVGPGRA